MMSVDGSPVDVAMLDSPRPVNDMAAASPLCDKRSGEQPLSSGERTAAATTAAKILLAACSPKEVVAAVVADNGLRSYYDLGGMDDESCDEFFITSSSKTNGTGLDVVPEQFDDAFPDDRNSYVSEGDDVDARKRSISSDDEGSACHVGGLGTTAVAMAIGRIEPAVESDRSSLASPAALSDLSSSDQGSFDARRCRKRPARTSLSRYANSEDLSSLVAGLDANHQELSGGSGSPLSLRWDDTAVDSSDSDIPNADAAVRSLPAGACSLQHPCTGAVEEAGVEVAESDRAKNTCNTEVPSAVASPGDVIVTVQFASPVSRVCSAAGDSTQSPSGMSFASSCDSVVLLASRSIGAAVPSDACHTTSNATGSSSDAPALAEKENSIADTAADPAGTAQSITAAVIAVDSHSAGSHVDALSTFVGTREQLHTPTTAAELEEVPASVQLAAAPATKLPVVLPATEQDASGSNAGGLEAAANATWSNSAHSGSCDLVASCKAAAASEPETSPEEDNATACRITDDCLQRVPPPAACSTPLQPRRQAPATAATALPMSPLGGTVPCPLHGLLSPRSRVGVGGRPARGVAESRLSARSHSTLSYSRAAGDDDEADFLYETVPLSPRRKYFHVVQRVHVDACSSSAAAAPSASPAPRGSTVCEDESPSYSEAVYINCPGPTTKHPAVPPLCLAGLGESEGESELQAVPTASAITAATRPTTSSSTTTEELRFGLAATLARQQRLCVSSDSLAGSSSAARLWHSRPAAAAATAAAPVVSTLFLGAVMPARSRLQHALPDVSSAAAGSADVPACSRAQCTPPEVTSIVTTAAISSNGLNYVSDVSTTPRTVVISLSPRSAGTPPGAVATMLGDRHAPKYRSEADLWLGQRPITPVSGHRSGSSSVWLQQHYGGAAAAAPSSADRSAELPAADRSADQHSTAALGSVERPAGSPAEPKRHVFRVATTSASRPRQLQVSSLTGDSRHAADSAVDAGSNGPTGNPDASAAMVLPQSPQQDVRDDDASDDDARRSLAAERLYSGALPRSHLTLTYSISAASINDGSGGWTPRGDVVPCEEAAAVDRLSAGPADGSDPLVLTASGLSCGKPTASCTLANAGVVKTDAGSSVPSVAGVGPSVSGSDGDTDVAAEDESNLDAVPIRDGSAAGSTPAHAADGTAAAGPPAPRPGGEDAAAATAAAHREHRESSTETVKDTDDQAVPPLPSTVHKPVEVHAGMGDTFSHATGKRRRKMARRAARQKAAAAAAASTAAGDDEEVSAAEQHVCAAENAVPRAGPETAADSTAAARHEAGLQPLSSDVGAGTPAAGIDRMTAVETAAAADSGGEESDAHQPDVSSLSETAWDDYQEKYNTTELDDVGDADSDESELFDDSCLQWEDELSVLDSTDGGGGGSGGSAAATARRGSAVGAVRRSACSNDATDGAGLAVGSTAPAAAAGALPPPPAQDDESEDSDLEDLHHVIEESSDQLLASERSLRKMRKDPFNYGIGVEPNRYSEVLATCRTNIKCLQVITGHLGHSGRPGLPNLTDDDIQRMLDLVARWRQLEAVAAERESQASALAGVCQGIGALRRALVEAEAELAGGGRCGSTGAAAAGKAGFDDVRQLEAHVRAIQTKRAGLLTLVSRLSQVNSAVTTFEAAMAGPGAHPAATVAAATVAAATVAAASHPNAAAAAAVSASCTKGHAAGPAAAAAAAAATGHERTGPRSSVAELEAAHRRCVASFAERTSELQTNVLLWHEFDESCRDLDYLVGVAEAARPLAGPTASDRSGSGGMGGDGTQPLGLRAACCAQSAPDAAGGAAGAAAGSAAAAADDEDVAACEQRLADLRRRYDRLAAAAGVTSDAWRRQTESALMALSLRIERLRAAVQTASEAAAVQVASITGKPAVAPAAVGAAAAAEVSLNESAATKHSITRTGAPRRPSGAIRRKAIRSPAVDCEQQVDVGAGPHRRRSVLPYVLAAWTIIAIILLLAFWLEPSCCDLTRCRSPWQSLGFDLLPPSGLPPV